MPCIRFLEGKKHRKGPLKQNVDEWGKWRTNSKIIIKKILKPQLKNEELKGSEITWTYIRTIRHVRFCPINKHFAVHFG